MNGILYHYIFNYIYYISTNSTDSGSEIMLCFNDVTHTFHGFSPKLRSRASLQHQWKEVGIRNPWAR